MNEIKSNIIKKWVAANSATHFIYLLIRKYNKTL